MLQTSLKYLRHHLRRALARPPRTAPILFANSFPKSGTHLLTQVLEGMTKIGPAVDSGLPAIVMFDGPTGQPRPIKAILSDLARLRAGDIAYGHLHATPEIVRAFFPSPSLTPQPPLPQGEGESDSLSPRERVGVRAGAALYFIYRDPRDVVVSHVHYVTEIEPNHVHHAYYRALPDFDARLKTSILGRPEMGTLFPDIRARFEPFLGWLRADVCVIKFEDFIQHRETTLDRILTHAENHGFTFHGSRPDALRTLSDSINPQKSPTFRSGKVGGWRGKFSEENMRVFKETAGDLLVRLGYEENEDW
ncbi:MAG: sulfotransferase domain-containing protein [Anaerolineales bacterium]|nr:sulfotransferase domain-containing protein [Anaerolineales bacterium]